MRSRAHASGCATPGTSTRGVTLTGPERRREGPRISPPRAGAVAAGVEPARTHAVPRSRIAGRHLARGRRDAQQNLGAGTGVLGGVVVLKRDPAVRRHVRQPIAVEPRPEGARQNERAVVLQSGLAEAEVIQFVAQHAHVEARAEGDQRTAADPVLEERPELAERVRRPRPASDP